MAGGTGWGAAWDVCEEGGSEAEEEMREAACEEGEEAAAVGGGAGEGIAACRSPASRRPGASGSPSCRGRRSS